MTQYFLNPNAVKVSKFKFFILFSLFFSCSFSFYGKTSIDPPGNEFVVVLDAGHGGKDTGNLGNGYIEKNIALNVILKVGQALKKHQGVKVLYTRTNDVFVTLKGRAEKANKADADLFVSVHANSYRTGGPHGTETFVLGTYRNEDNLEVAKRENSVIYLEEDYEEKYDGFDPEDPSSYIGMTLMQEEYLDQSILLADGIQKEFTNHLNRTNRGVKKAGFLVLRETYMPSVLVEIGFLTNKAEGRYLNTKKGQGEIASAIASGLIRYKNYLNLNAAQINGKITLPETSKNLHNEEGLVYRIQLAAGSKPIATKPFNFKGLKGVERKKINGRYKYYYGKSSDYSKIQSLQQEAKDKGFDGAYIVGFKDGKKVKIDKD